MLDLAIGIDLNQDVIGENPCIEFSPAAKIMEAELRSLMAPSLVPAEDGGVPRGRPHISRREIYRAIESHSGKIWQ
jgi:hypothetical protein